MEDKLEECMLRVLAEIPVVALGWQERRSQHVVSVAAEAARVPCPTSDVGREITFRRPRTSMLVVAATLTW